MFVSVSTRCFARESFESVLRHIADLEFNKIELAILEDGPHLRPSEIAADPEQALRRLRSGPSLTVSAFDLDFGQIDEKTYVKRFEAMCRFAKPLTVAVLTIPASSPPTSLNDEIRRVGVLNEIALREGLVLTLETHSQTLTADPANALAICKALPGLGLTIDPSHYIIQNQKKGVDELYAYARNVHLRDTGREPGRFQVLIGQGEIEYNRIVTLLERHGYDRALTVSILDLPDNPFDTEAEVRKLKLLLESLL